MQGTLPDNPSRTYRILSRKPGQPSWTRLDIVRGDQVVDSLKAIEAEGFTKRIIQRTSPIVGKGEKPFPDP